MMTTHPNATSASVRAEDILPGEASHAEFNGVSVRKGTVAAFLQNAKSWSDPATADADRERLSNDITASIPALQALGIFDVFTVRDDRLRALIERG